jgi:polar amino acid transport system substrate-binding protein
MKFFRTFFGAFLLLPILAHADTWSIRADSWCPYNCEPGAVAPGYMIEILDMAAKASGNTLDYKLAPWSRAIYSARNGEITGVVGLGTLDKDGMVLSEKMGVDQACFYVNQGSTFKYSGPKDLENLKSIGTAQGYEYTPDFRAWAKANAGKVQVMTGDDPLGLNLKKLKANRIEAFLQNVAVLEYSKKTMPELKDVVSAGCLEPIALYAGFGAKSPKAGEITKAVNAKMADLKKSGELKKLLDKYGVGPW